MKENANKNSLAPVNENSIFYKIKNFFKRLFYKENNIVNNTFTDEKQINTIKCEDSRNPFIVNVNNIESEETKLLKLQKQYRSGKIKEEELTREQVISLCDLYDKQIANLKKSNAIRKQKLLEYRKKCS